MSGTDVSGGDASALSRLVRAGHPLKQKPLADLASLPKTNSAKLMGGTLALLRSYSTYGIHL